MYRPKRSDFWKDDQDMSVLHKRPSEEFELTANTLQAHMKPHGKLILKPLIYLTVHSWDDLNAVTFLWVLREFASNSVSLLWPICEINR